MPTVWPLGAAKEQQVQNVCTCTARAQCTPAPFFIRRQVGLAKVHPCTELVSLAQRFVKPKDPSSKRFSAPGACNLHPTEVAPPMDFKLAQYACDLRVWYQWCHDAGCACQGRQSSFARDPPVLGNFDLLTPNLVHLWNFNERNSMVHVIS